MEEVHRMFEKLDIEYEVIEHKALFSASDGVNVNFLIDRGLLKKNKVCFHPNMNTKSFYFLSENTNFLIDI